MCIDEERDFLMLRVKDAQWALSNAAWGLFIYDHSLKIALNNLHSVEIEDSSMGAVGHVFKSLVSLEGCVFDGSPLTKASPVLHGPILENNVLYQCDRCKICYLMPSMKRSPLNTGNE